MGYEMDDEYAAAFSSCQKLVQAIHQLHHRGYEQLRLAPGMSPSGCHWRCSIAPKSNMSDSNGAMIHNFDGLSVHGSISGSGEGGYQGIEFSAYSTPSALADAIQKTFPEVMQESFGPDPDYVRWYEDLLTYVNRGLLPVAYADWYTPPDPRFLPFWNGESDLLLPPPGGAAKTP